MRGFPAIVDDIRSAAPPHQDSVDEPTRQRLAGLTTELLAARPDGAAELQRYRSITTRTAALPEQRVAAALRGRTVLVTGGCGCIGTALLRQVRRLCPARFVSADIAQPRRPVPGVEYATVDVRSPGVLDRLFARYRPDIVFHLAAQRDPGLAERHLGYTVETNVLGTVQVVRAAERHGARRFVYASTGKALRPYSRCVYTASKRVGEWLVADAARRGRMTCTGVRFTHVVDNSILHDRLRRWCDTGEVVRLHAPDTVFYAQSAIESAQLLLTAALSPADDVFRLYAIRDLGWPVSLLDVALGVIADGPRIAPIYLAGHEPGYEEAPYPGLYDPALSGDVSPLLNAMEAHQVEASACAGIDGAAVAAYDAPEVVGRLPELQRWCRVTADRQARRVLGELGWDLLVAGVRATPPAVLDRMARLTEEYRPTMSDEHRRIDDLIRRHADRATDHSATDHRAADRRSDLVPVVRPLRTPTVAEV
ncbi:polysaccharide biosynthesis protein [Planosporangium thailandense]|uniref:Polysaccharide biosynthesis protein n=1 Tax=Planosporangium thailandense TaxID=765197 RepID=A0ABX0Y3L1_9ACTN|nr:polysaccharide biosynthesis protein [Planosporangium thailandense]NJC72976.1 polysaccharide biosynthesis protein [Planosporangium thailandense]